MGNTKLGFSYAGLSGPDFTVGHFENLIKVINFVSLQHPTGQMT